MAQNSFMYRFVVELYILKRSEAKLGKFQNLALSVAIPTEGLCSGPSTSELSWQPNLILHAYER